MKIIPKLLSLMFVLIIITHLSGQNINNISDRYIIIKDLDEFFIENNGFIETQKIIIYNFDNEQSSKPYFENINGLNGVVKFSMASRAEAIDKTRRCNITLNSHQYIDTFRKILIILEVKYIIINDTAYSVDDFINFIKNK